MYKMTILALFFSFCANALAYEFPIEITEYIDDVKIDAYIAKDDINNDVQWTPFESPPPLSIHDALKAVQSYIVSNADLPTTALIGIELKRIPRHETHWHYLVKVKSKLGGREKPHFYVVLMDGKVVSAIREPESVK